jgi:hypothetical protein
MEEAQPDDQSVRARFRDNATVEEPGGAAMSKDARDDWFRVIPFTAREVTFLLADLTRLDDDLSTTTRALKERLKKEFPRPHLNEKAS